MKAQNYRRNRQIRIPEVRLIDETGEQVGIVQTKDAQRRADEAGLDLVEVSPMARPPVCRIMDFGKFKYEQRKREKTGQGKKAASALKEMRVRPAIDKHDLSYRLEQGARFLREGHKVLVVCIFRGRQMRHPEHGYNVMKHVADELAEISKVESPAKMMGRRMTMMLSPTAVKKPETGGKKSGGSKGSSNGGKDGAKPEKAPRKAAAEAPSAKREGGEVAAPKRTEGGEAAASEAPSKVGDKAKSGGA